MLDEINERKIMRDHMRKEKLQRKLREMKALEEESEKIAQKYNEERIKKVKEQEDKAQ